MSRHLEDETAPENYDQSMTPASSQGSRVASNEAESTSNTRSELARDPPEQDDTMHPRKRVRREEGESTALEDYEMQRVDVLDRYGASYRLNRHRSGVFKFAPNRRSGNTPVHGEKPTRPSPHLSDTGRQLTNMEWLWQERGRREDEKKEASLSLEKNWLFDQARQHHALTDLRSRRENDEDEVMAEPQEEGQPEHMALDPDNPAEYVSDEDLLDEERVALELGLQDDQERPLDQSNLEAGCTQGSESKPLAQTASVEHQNFEGLTQTNSLLEDLPRASSEHDHQITEKLPSTPPVHTRNNCQGLDVASCEPSDWLDKDTGKPSGQRRRRVPDETPFTPPAPPVRASDGPPQHQATHTQSDAGFRRVPDSETPFTPPAPPVRASDGPPQHQATHTQSDAGFRRVPDSETPFTPPAPPVRASDGPPQHQATHTQTDAGLRRVPDSETSFAPPAPPVRASDGPPQHQVTHTQSDAGLRRVPDGETPFTPPAPPVRASDGPPQHQATHTQTDAGLRRVPDSETSFAPPAPPVRASDGPPQHQVTHTQSDAGLRRVPDSETPFTPPAPPVRASDGPLQHQAMRTQSDAGLRQVPDETTLTPAVPPARTCDAPPRHEAIHTLSEQGLRQVPPTHPVRFRKSLPRGEDSHMPPEQGNHRAPDETPITPTLPPARACDSPPMHKDPCVQEMPQANALGFALSPEQESEKSRRPVSIPSISVCEPSDPFSPALKAWVSKQVNDARERVRREADNTERDILQKENRARKMMNDDLQKKAKAGVAQVYRDRLNTWDDTPESLKRILWNSADEKIGERMMQFDLEAQVHAQSRKKGYEDKENRSAREAREVALVKIGQAKESMALPTSSYLNTLRQVNEKWLEPEASSSAHKKAESEASKKERRRQTITQRERSSDPIEPSSSKGKARAMLHDTVSTTNERMGAQPSRSPLRGIVTPQLSPQPTLSENLDIYMDVDPSGSTTGLTPPRETAPDGQALKESANASSHVDVFQLEHEEAEERRRRRRARDLKAEQEKVRREQEADQRRIAYLVNLSQSKNTSSRDERADVTCNEVPGVHSSADQVGSDTQDSAAQGVALQSAPSAIGYCGLRDGGNETVTDANNLNIPGGGPQPGIDALLSLLLNQARNSEVTNAQMASQINELRRAIIELLERGVAPGANQPAQAPPLPVTPHPPPFRARRFGPPGEPREAAAPTTHRSVEVNEFHAHLREFVCDLFHKGDTKYWPEPPTDEEIEVYEAYRRPEDGPTPIDFRLDFSHHPPTRSVWNRRAAEVFVEQYRLSNYPDREHDGVEDEFWKRLKRLDQKSVDTGPAAKNRASGAAKRLRRRRRIVTLFDSRLAAIQSRETTHRFIPALELLSRSGMSEDESDHGGKGGALQGRRYKITNPRWRSPEVTKWLRTMDLIYAGTKIYEDNTRGPGNQFRQRYPSTKEQVGHPIIGLPRNFYDARWLRTLTPRQLGILCVQPEIDLEFSIEERRHASKFIGIKGQLQEDRIESSAEANENEILQWVLTGNGFWRQGNQRENS